MITTKNLSNKKRILFIVSTPMVIDFFMLKILKSIKKNYIVTIVCNRDHDSEGFEKLAKFFHVNHIPIERDINLYKDLICLFKLLNFLIFTRFDAIHAITPKAGLLSMIAGVFTMHKVRIFTFQGQVWYGKKGFLRLILKFCDYIISKLSSNLLFVTNDEINFLKKEKILNSKQDYKLIHNGSICGINLNRFKSHKKDVHLIKLIKNNFTFIFLGRVNKDKGIDLLINSFLSFSKKYRSNLLIVGPNELKKPYINLEKSGIYFFPKTPNPERFLNVSDCLILPSTREAFGMVVLEAASMGIPSIGSNIYGLRESILNNVTGLLFDNGSQKSLIKMMEKIYINKKLRMSLGQNAKRRVIENFNENSYIDFYLKYYSEVL